MVMVKSAAAVALLLGTLCRDVQAQTGGPFDHTTSPAVSFDFVVAAANAVIIQDFCVQVGVTHPTIMDLKMVVSFETVQQAQLSMTVLDQPTNQLDDMDAGTAVFFTTYSFHTPATEMGFIDQSPVSGFFYAPELSATTGLTNLGTWTLTVQDLVNDGDSGNLVSFTPIFNDPAACGQSGAPSSAPSKAPSPSPVAPTSNAPTVPACFAGSNLVHVRGKGDVPMDSLAIGDFVQSKSHGYTKVYGFLHLHRDLPTDFLQISYYDNETKSSSFLEVTADHFLFSQGRTVAAHEVKVGTILDGDGVSLHVTQIQTVQRKGVYAPATESGELIVAGVHASNYVQLLSSRTPVSQHIITHVFLAPLRILSTVGRHYGDTYTEQGYNTCVVFYLRISAQLERMPPVLLSIVTVVVLAPLMLVLVLLEYAVGLSFPLWLLLCTTSLALITTMRYRSQNVQRKSTNGGGACMAKRWS